MAALPLAPEDDAKQQLPPDLVASYRRDLGIGEPFGFLRPWQRLLQGKRLGTSAQGVTGKEMISKLGGSLAVGSVALVFTVVAALAFALFRLWLRGSAAEAYGDWFPALALGTPVFIPALFLAPYVAEVGCFLPDLFAA